MPTKAHRSPSERLQERQKRWRTGRLSYSVLAKRHGVSKGMMWRMAHGIEPVDEEARRAFGLPPLIGTKTQYQQVLYCIVPKCRKAFIPNHPQRKRCFECSPVRKHK